MSIIECLELLFNNLLYVPTGKTARVRLMWEKVSFWSKPCTFAYINILQETQQSCGFLQTYNLVKTRKTKVQSITK